MKDEIDELLERGVKVIPPANYDSKKEEIGAAIGIGLFLILVFFVGW